ncbi:MAG TPA: hypothetical protein VF522_13115 [Ramlibacter sp.]|uniref:hypothetical protein n=1 Tax=Ramlibacter sp. TaxID=1917967 RepID=UPI002ED5D647
MLPAKIYPIVIPAGGAFPLQVHGDMFKVLSSTGTLTVTGDSFGNMGQVLPGQGLERTPFTRLLLTDTSGAVNVVQLLVSGAGFIDDRITGEVSVIDGAKARTLSLRAFSGFVYQAGVAANYSAVQLLNKVGSGRRIVVSQIICMSTNSNWFASLQLAGAAIGAVYGAGPASKSGGGAADTVGELRAVAAVASYAAGNEIAQICGLQNTTAIYKLTEPVVLAPGQAIVAGITNLVNVSLGATFEYFTEDV